jgi:hypothetical protein
MVIIPGRPSFRSLTWWVDDQGDEPAAAWELNGVPIPVPTLVDLSQRKLGPASLGKRLALTRALQPGIRYELIARGSAGNKLGSATSRTLPEKLEPGQPFTIAIGSCFCPFGGGVVANEHTPQTHAGETDPIRLRFLVGDQIYMDLSPSNGQPCLTAPEPWERYRDHWRNSDFLGFLAAHPTLVMADDHEFWNDYPHSNIYLVWTNPDTDIRARLAKELDSAFDLYQAALNVDSETFAPASGANFPRTFELDVDRLSFFVLDTRTRRSRYDSDAPRMCDPAEFGRALAWMDGLKGPGVLFLSQPAIERPASSFERFTHSMGDVNLPDYAADFERLWNSLFDAPHDVLVLSGDIHWSRLVSATFKGRAIYEAISSPLSRIPFHSKPQMPPKVEWGEHVRKTAPCTAWSAAIDEKNTYSTISFSPRSDAAFDVTVRWWALSAESGHPPQLAHDPVTISIR